MSESLEHENQTETEANNEDNQQQDHSADSENDVQDSQSSETEVIESNGTKYSVGIDLGTTHCVLSYVDLTKDEDDIIQEVMAIPQLTSLGVVEDKKQLPSFLYIAHDAEIAEGTTTGPGTSKP